MRVLAGCMTQSGFSCWALVNTIIAHPVPYKPGNSLNICQDSEDRVSTQVVTFTAESSI